MPDEQLTFTVEPRKLARTGDVATAKAGATLRGKDTHRRACLTAHARPDATSGLIDDEVAALTGLDLQEARRRCVDLRNLGLLEWKRDDLGRIETRTNPAGNASSVSRLTPAGRTALA
jgi:uncharacterized protein (DUF1684 family)